MSERRKRHSPEQIVKKLRDGEAMLNAGNDLAAVFQSLEISTRFHEQAGKDQSGLRAYSPGPIQARQHAPRTTKPHGMPPVDG